MTVTRTGLYFQMVWTSRQRRDQAIRSPNVIETICSRQSRCRWILRTRSERAVIFRDAALGTEFYKDQVLHWTI
eukprot:4658984-Amphidinium_carterae.1